MEVVDFLKTPERYRRLGGKIPKGVLIVGAPGTGKTLLAKAVAGEAQVPFLSFSGSEFVEMFVGVGAARVRDLFQQAEKLAPCIIFIDELDALGKARGASGLAGNDEREQTLNQLLVQMDGFDTQQRRHHHGRHQPAGDSRSGAAASGALRPARGDRPARHQRAREDPAGARQAPDAGAGRGPAGRWRRRPPALSGADLANIVNEAALRAARHDKPAVEMSDFDEAIDRVEAGLEKKNRVMNPKEKETVAHHEAGHALVAESRPTADKVSQDLDHSARHRRARIHAAAADRRPLPAQMRRAARSPGRAARRAGRRRSWSTARSPRARRTTCSGRPTWRATWSRNMA